jgi:hypothetical protein
MADEKRGYGPPKVEGYTATLAEGAPPSGRLAEREAQPPSVKITLHGQGFIQRAMPLIVKIGDQAVMGNFHITPDECHVTFHLDRIPEDGAVIKVGYGGSELVELPERFSRRKLQSEGGGVS